MAFYNRTVLMGNLTRDPELAEYGEGLKVCRFTVACSERFKDRNGQPQQKTLFMDCSAFGKRAEVINQYFKKGNPIHIDGKLEQHSWEDEDNKRRTKISLKCENFSFVDSKQESNQEQTSKPTQQFQQPQRDNYGQQASLDSIPKFDGILKMPSQYNHDVEF